MSFKGMDVKTIMVYPKDNLDNNLTTFLTFFM